MLSQCKKKIKSTVFCFVCTKYILTSAFPFVEADNKSVFSAINSSDFYKTYIYIYINIHSPKQFNINLFVNMFLYYSLLL